MPTQNLHSKTCTVNELGMLCLGISINSSIFCLKKVLLEVAIRKGSISGEKRKMFSSTRLVYTKTFCGPFIRCTTMQEKMHIIPSAMQFYSVSKTKGMSCP